MSSSRALTTGGAGSPTCRRVPGRCGSCGHVSSVNAVAFSPNGRFALAGSADKTLKLWDLATGRELRSFKGPASFVTSVRFSRDGRFALSGHMNGMLELWNVETGRELRSFTGDADWIKALRSSRPEATSHNFGVSEPLDKTKRPSGENATDVTQPEFPVCGTTSIVVLSCAPASCANTPVTANSPAPNHQNKSQSNHNWPIIIGQS
jgi:WD domain, G-beta repeat